MVKNKELNLGLDIGTNSVGWALLDENNNLIKKNGFTFWGVRMFEEAKDASSRRAYRSARRRLQRRKERIKLLREIFDKEISKVDFTFFDRLEDSFYKQEDKKYNNYYNLFTSEYTDKDFFTQFPTIYHLRNFILKSNEKVDIRFLYLACHNIIKYRGNFLHHTDSFNKGDTSNLKLIFEDFNTLIKDLSVKFEEYENDVYFETIDNNFDNCFFDKLGELLNKRSGKKEKQEDIAKLFDVQKKSLVFDYLVKLLTDSKVSFENLPFVKDLCYEKSELELSSVEDLDSKIDELGNNCPDIYDLIAFSKNVKTIIDYYYLLKLLSGSNSISEAMIKQYDDHQKDLIKLKCFVKKYLPSKYNECFKAQSGFNNYAKYIGMTTVKGKLVRFSHCKRADFYKYLKSLFALVNNIEAETEKKYFEDKINGNEFLLRQNSDQNGSIPMQLHLKELKNILNNQTPFYDFINEIDDEGISNYDKIISIFKFKIPYYIGPIGLKSKYGWAERKSDEKIYPWNFDSVLDKENTAEKFILRMQNKCTYLKGDDDYCLPKKSLLYSEYECLSIINKISINGTPIDLVTKEELFNKVFKTTARPTYSNIKKFFADRGLVVDKFEFNCDMSSYVQMVDIFGKDFVDNNIELIEKIIKDITIFEDKSILETRLKNYKLSNEIIKKIKNLNYGGFGRLSRNLLTNIKYVDKDNDILVGPSIIEIMRETNLNLQEILFSTNYHFQELIDAYNKKYIIEDETIENFIDQNISINPIMRRAMIQSINIINEIEKIFNQKINKYYIECSRTNKEVRGEKGKKKSRYETIKELYASCKDLIQDYGINLEELNNNLEEVVKKDTDVTDSGILLSDAVFLYFTQLGRCMYTLEPIDFNELLNSKNMLYDIDHIYPQSLIKDDSMNNKVLVKKSKNNEKSDKFIFEIHNFLNPKCRAFFEMLTEKGLISKEKKRRLLKTEISDEELEGFVNRQIVSTNQSVKGLITILKLYKNVKSTDIIMSKAENISEFRNEYNLIKSRTANNYHHAHDAYLNVVVGKALHNYFSLHNLMGNTNFVKIRHEDYAEGGERDKVTLNIKTILGKNRYFNGKFIWNKDLELGNPSIFKTFTTKTGKVYNEYVFDNGKIFHDLYERFDVNETIMTYNSGKLLSQVTIMPAGKGSVPIKSTTKRLNIEKYGGIKQPSYSKFIIINQLSSNNEKKAKLIAIPKLHIDNVDNYLKSKGINNYNIVVENIKNNDLLFRENRKSYITSVSKDSFLIKNAVDRNFNFRSIRLIRAIDSFFDNKKNNRYMKIDDDNNNIVIAYSNRGYNRIISFDEIDWLFESIKKLYSHSAFSYSQTNSILEMTNNFYNLSIDNKLIVINMLLQYLKTNERKLINLSITGSDKANNVGALTFSSLKVGDKIIRTSYTGYYKTILFEVK